MKTNKQTTCKCETFGHEYCEDYKQSVLPTPWKIVSEDKWPFIVAIVASNGVVVLKETLYAFSSEDKSFAEARAREGNDRQFERLNKIVNSVNNQKLLVELLKEAVEFGNEPEGWNKRVERAIIKVEGK